MDLWKKEVASRRKIQRGQTQGPGGQPQGPGAGRRPWKRAMIVSLISKMVVPSVN